MICQGFNYLATAMSIAPDFEAGFFSAFKTGTINIVKSPDTDFPSKTLPAAHSDSSKTYWSETIQLLSSIGDFSNASRSNFTSCNGRSQIRKSIDFSGSFGGFQAVIYQ